ncbi:hypothetical protein PAMA_005761 [Pampus argenteus]
MLVPSIIVSITCYTATLGTLEFSLLYDQENNALHCTINKAKLNTATHAKPRYTPHFTATPPHFHATPPHFPATPPHYHATPSHYPATPPHFP